MLEERLYQVDDNLSLTPTPTAFTGCTRKYGAEKLTGYSADEINFFLQLQSVLIVTFQLMRNIVIGCQCARQMDF